MDAKDYLGTAFINFVAGFAVAVALTLSGVPQLVLLIAQVILVLASTAVVVARRRRTKRARTPGPGHH